MLKLNRKTEYALLALRYMSRREPGAVTSVREIAEHYAIPEMLLAKVLQRLKRGRLVTSVKGSSGGYVLERLLRGIGLVEVLGLFGEQVALVECIDSPKPCGCQQRHSCDIRDPVQALNERLMAYLEGMTLADFFAPESPGARPPRLSIFRAEPDTYRAEPDAPSA